MSKETKFAYAVIISALVYTAVFHLFVFDTLFGWPLVVFAGLILLTLLIFRALHDSAQNLWAYAFLGPILMVSVAELLYANPVMRLFGFFISLASLSFLSFWLLSPKVNWKGVKSFWSPSWFLDTFAPVHMKGPLSRLSLSKASRQGLVGAVIAIPFALVFLALFLSADPLIGKVLTGIFDINNPTKLFFQLVFDVFIAFYLTRALWLAVTRMLHDRHPRWNEYKISESTTAYTTFLAVLNVLFLIFIGFQFVYFFGGQAIVESYGLTYADYARQGFFQLFTVSVLIFLILYAIKWKTRMRSVTLCLLSVGLVIQSWVVIVSALRRLGLYIDAYGLTVLRYWAFAGLIVAAAGLLILALWILAKSSFSSLSKVLTLGSLYVFAGLLLVNHEALIVDWNASREATELVAPDFIYPMELSSDALPSYVRWLKQEDETREIACSTFERHLAGMMFDSYMNDKQKFLKEQFFSYQDMSSERVPLMEWKSLMDEFNFIINDQWAQTAYRIYADPIYDFETQTFIDRNDTCQLKDWKNALKIFASENQANKLKDIRLWTWSDEQALKALKSL